MKANNSRPRDGRFMKLIAVAVALSFAGGIAGYHTFGDATSVEAATISDRPQITIRKCAGGQRITCVVDGDTLWIDGEKIRVADIDTPEISEPK